MSRPDDNPSLPKSIEQLDTFEELLAVQRATQRLQQVLEPEELAQEIIGVLEDTLGYDFAAVLLIDGPSQRLRAFALSDQGQGPGFIVRDREYVEARGVAVGTGVTGWVAANGRSARIADVRADPRYLGLREGIVSELCVPMLVRGNVIGVINIETTRPDAYGEPDQRVLEIIASNIAVAIENSRLQHDLVHSQRLEAVGRLASGIAHDFNNLLTVINGYAEMIRDRQDLDEDLRHAVGEIAEAGRRAALMTKQLLAFGRKSVLTPRIFDPGQEIANLSSLLRRLLGEDVELTLRTDPAAGTVEFDPTQFGQVIVNLAVNARDAMPTGGRLEIATRGLVVDPASPLVRDGMQAGHYAVVSVTDSGPGLSESASRNLFEPFYSTKSHGTGLGLAMAHGVVSQSGGQIRLESAPGEGARFAIYLPVVTAPRRDLEPAPVRAREPVIAGTVLLVEDDDAVRTLMATLLEGLGYRVLATPSGPAALRRVDEDELRPELVICDVVMPGMDGPTVVRRLRERCPDLKVLFISAYPGQRADDDGGFTEADHLISKPFTRAALKRKLAEVLAD